jgi:DnaK suppressor protein
VYNLSILFGKFYMNDAFITEMKERLTIEQTRLQKDLGGFADPDKKAKQANYTTRYEDFGDDEDENANEVAAYSNNLPLENELEKELRDIDNALKRINEAAYGTCKYCNSEINEDRLRARPTAGSCIACKKTLTQEV